MVREVIPVFASHPSQNALDPTGLEPVLAP
jgi:hypothetical protein